MNGIILYVLIGIVFLIICIIIYLFVIIRASRKKQVSVEEGGDKSEETTAVDDMRPISALQVRRSFFRAMKLLKANVPGRHYRYQIPWFMMIGEAASGKTAVLGNTGLSLPLGPPTEEGIRRRQGCNWWFFEKGIVLDVNGDYVLRAEGKPSDDKGWQSLLKLTRRYRPERPIDGVILTIPCTDLIGSKEASDERIAKLEEKASLLYDKLAQAHKTLGICFPLYILVTKCDRITGFSSFCGEIPDRFQHDIFGWSNPYALGTTYTTHWVDETFQNVYRDLYRTQIEAIADGIQVQDKDGFFLFPAEFQAMLDPLRIYLDGLFKRSIYRESFFLRGLYFCGNCEKPDMTFPVPAKEQETLDNPATSDAIADSPASVEQTGTGLQKILFLKHLFEKKIFPEYGLARPASRIFISKNRRVVIIQALLLVFVITTSLGLWRGYANLNTIFEKEEDILERIEEVLKETKEPSNKAVQDLLDYMREVGDLDSVFIPLSWRSDLEVRLREVQKVAIESIILPTLRRELESKVTNLPEAIKEKSLQESVKYIIDLENAVYSFNGLGLLIFDTESKPGFVRDLDDGRFSGELRAEFEEELGEAGEGYPVPSLEASVVKIKRGRKWRVSDKSNSEIDYFVAWKVDNGVDNRLYISRYSENYVEDKKEKLEQVLSFLEWKDVKDVSDSFLEALKDAGSTQKFKRVDDLTSEERKKGVLKAVNVKIGGLVQDIEEDPDIQLLETTLIDLKYGQLEIDNIREFQKTIDQADKALGENDLWKLLNDPEQIKAIEGSFLQEAYEETLELLKQESGTREGILKWNDDSARMELSPEVLGLKNILDLLLKDAFIKGLSSEDAIELGTEIPSGTRLIWSKKPLGDSIELSKSYDEFIGKGFQELLDQVSEVAQITDLDWDYALENMVRRGLEIQMNDRIARAQEFVDPTLEGLGDPFTKSIVDEIESFKDSRELLGEILLVFKKMKYTESYRDLSGLIVRQASRLLSDVDYLFDKAKPYSLAEYSWDSWDGRTPISSSVFGFRNSAELSQYLDVQREGVRTLASEYAEPLVAFLGNSNVSRSLLIQKWQRIISGFGDYDDQKPCNSLVSLEKFMLSDIDEINLSNYPQKLKDPCIRLSNGDFFSKRLDGLRNAIHRRCQALAVEEAIPGYAKIERVFNGKLAGRFPFSAVDARTHADPYDIRSFYVQFDKYARITRTLLQANEESGKAEEDALDFLEKMEQVRSFFSSFLEGEDENLLPVYDLDVEFRVNREREKDGDRIVRWELEVGKSNITNQNDELNARWCFGDAIKVTLSWSGDSDGSYTMVYKYHNSWSLFSLLMKQATAAEDFDRLVDERPHTLRFTPASGLVVFMRVGIVAPDTKDQLRLPPFPKTAPRLGLRPKD